MSRRSRLFRTEGFFDRQAVMQALAPAERRYLMQAAGRTRKVARWSIRKRKKISEPGQPPSSHVGTLRRSIQFYLDLNSRKVIVGAPRIPSASPYVVPEILEAGGRVSRRLRVRPEKQRARSAAQAAAYARLVRAGRLPGRQPAVKRVQQRYRARPYMQPALEKVTPELAGMWKDQIRGR